MGTRRTLWIALVLLPVAAAAAGQYGPGPEAFPAVGRFIFRNEAEAIARKVAATRGMDEPVHVVEVHVEQTSMTPGGRGWSVVVVGKVPGGCHAVTVGIAADDGRVYAVGDRRARPPKPPPDCERWFIEGAEGATATLDTAPIAKATPPPKVIPPKPGVRVPTREDVLRTASDQAAKKGYREIEVMMTEQRPGPDGGAPIWRADLIGMTQKGCGIFKIELSPPPEGKPDWKMRFQNNQIGGKDVKLEECREWYEGEGKSDSPMDWIPGRVEWVVEDSNNLQ